MKILMMSFALLAASGAYAGESCDVELQGGVRITNSAIEFSAGGNEEYKIVNDQELWVNNKALVLDSKQEELVKDYAHAVRAMVPEVRQLTLDGVDLASEAMGLVFDEFLGADNKATHEINSAFVLLRKDIEKSFSSEHPIYFNQSVDHANNFMGKEFEARVNTIMEDFSKEIVWSVMKAVGASIFSASDDFETRMNKFGQKMDYEMNLRAEKLEKRGSAVCRSAILLDAQEEALKKSVSEIASFNFIAMKTKVNHPE